MFTGFFGFGDDPSNWFCRKKGHENLLSFLINYSRFDRLRSLRRQASPNEIDGHSRENYQQAGPGCSRLINEENDQDHRGANNVECRNDRISKCFIRPLGIGLFHSEYENAGDREDIKYQRGRYYIGKQVVVKAAVAAVGLDRTGKNVKRSENSLDYQAPSRHVKFV